MNCLINLRHLHASSYTIDKINGIGKLTKLQELHEFQIKSQEGHRITELSDMNDLRGSLCILNLEMVIDPAEALKANIAEKDYVTALELSWSYLMVLPPLGQLENLQKLRFHDLPSIKDIDSEFCGTSHVVFRSLEELSFAYMENWESWTYAGSSDFIPNLQKLQILRPCNKLRKLPFESLGSAMKKIIIDYSDPYDDTFSRYLQGLNGLNHLEVYGNWPYQSCKLIILPCKQLLSLEYLFFF